MGKLSKQEFIKKYYPIVKKVLKEQNSSILPETAMSQLIIENGFREFDPGSTLFGIKGKGNKIKTKEVIDGKMVVKSEDFARFETIKEALKGYVNLIENNKRYSEALKKETPEEQIKAITDAGYATLNKEHIDEDGNLIPEGEYERRVISVLNSNKDIFSKYNNVEEGSGNTEFLGYKEINDKKVGQMKMPNGDILNIGLYGIDPRIKKIGNDYYFSTRKYSEGSERENVKIPTERKEDYKNGYFPTDDDNLMTASYRAYQSKTNEEVYNNALDYYAEKNELTGQEKKEAERLLSTASRNLGEDSPAFRKIGMKYFDDIFVPQFKNQSQKVIDAQKQIVFNIEDKLDDPSISDEEVSKLSKELEEETKTLNEIQETATEFETEIDETLKETKKVENPLRSIVETLDPILASNPVFSIQGFVSDVFTTDTTEKNKTFDDKYKEKKDIYNRWNELSKAVGIEDSYVTGNTSQPGITRKGEIGNYETKVSDVGNDGVSDDGVRPDPNNMEELQETAVTEGTNPLDSDAYLDEQIKEIDEQLSNMESVKEFAPDFSGLEKESPYSNLIENVGDISRMVIGAKGAFEEIPEYQESKMFTEYLQDASRRKNMGLSPEEMALRTQLAERGYGYDVKNIRRLSGGSSGVALGNLGRAAGSLQNRYAQIGAEDSMVRRQNLQRFDQASVRGETVNRQKFEDNLTQSMLNKQAGASLVRDSLKNIQERSQYEKQYGEGSMYNELLKETVAGKQQTRHNLDLAQKMLKQRQETELKNQKKTLEEKRKK